MWNENTAKNSESKYKKDESKTTSAENKDQSHLHQRIHKRLRNACQWKLCKGKTQNKSGRYIPRSPSTICTTGKLIVLHHSRRLGLFPGQGKAKGLWIRGHRDSWTKSKLYSVLRPILPVLFHHLATKLPAARFQSLVIRVEDSSLVNLINSWKGRHQRHHQRKKSSLSYHYFDKSYPYAENFQFAPDFSKIMNSIKAKRKDYQVRLPQFKF